MSHRRTQNSGDWSNYLSSQLSNLSVEIKKTVGTASSHVAEQTQGLRQDVNSKISNVSVWIDSKMQTPPARVTIFNQKLSFCLNLQSKTISLTKSMIFVFTPFSASFFWTIILINKRNWNILIFFLRLTKPVISF